MGLPDDLTQALYADAVRICKGVGASTPAHAHAHARASVHVREHSKWQRASSLHAGRLTRACQVPVRRQVRERGDGRVPRRPEDLCTTSSRSTRASRHAAAAHLCFVLDRLRARHAWLHGCVHPAAHWRAWWPSSHAYSLLTHLLTPHPTPAPPGAHCDGGHHGSRSRAISIRVAAASASPRSASRRRTSPSAASPSRRQTHRVAAPAA